jgi:hypothetical protein
MDWIKETGFCKFRAVCRIGHILRRNCLLKHVIGGNIEGRMVVTGIQGRRRKQLMDDRKEKGGYCKLKEETAENSLWKRLWTCHKTDCGMNEWMNVGLQFAIKEYKN